LRITSAQLINKGASANDHRVGALLEEAQVLELHREKCCIALGPGLAVISNSDGLFPTPARRHAESIYY